MRYKIWVGMELRILESYRQALGDSANHKQTNNYLTENECINNSLLPQNPVGH